MGHKYLLKKYQKDKILSRKGSWGFTTYYKRIKYSDPVCIEEAGIYCLELNFNGVRKYVQYHDNKRIKFLVYPLISVRLWSF